jgi:hypothetical protein
MKTSIAIVAGSFIPTIVTIYVAVMVNRVKENVEEFRGSLNWLMDNSTPEPEIDIYYEIEENEEVNADA